MLSITDLAIREISSAIDIGPDAYEAAAKRYRDVGQWLSLEPSIANFDPDVFAQGSFSLGTVTRPLVGEDFDLDLVCELRNGVRQLTHSQEQLKQAVGVALEVRPESLDKHRFLS